MQNVPNEPEAPAPKKPRRRFTEEERIAHREAEILAIREKRKKAVRDRIDEAKALLAECAQTAEKSGMEPEWTRCSDALAVLIGTKAVEAKD